MRWLRAVLALALSYLGGPALAQGATSATVSAELLGRILGADADVLVGELPAELPAHWAVPEGLRLDASVVRRWAEGTAVQLYLTADGEAGPEAARAALTGSLTAAGLEPVVPNDEPDGWWGFTSGERASEPELFCGEGAYAQLFAVLGSRPAQFTLSLSPRDPGSSAYGPCDLAAYAPPAPRAPRLALAPPPEAQLTGVETGYPLSQAASYVVFAAEAQAPIAAHYRALLEASGWRQTLAGGDAALGYSRWRSPDGAWQLVMAFAGPPLSGGVVGMLLAEPAP